jgi:hypothetical protein
MRKIRWALIAAIAALALTIPALADTNHGRPTCTAPPMDEVSFGSRDGFDHIHAIDATVPGALVELEGYLNVCRTNDSTVIEGASGSARAVLVAKVKRVGLRVLLQQHVPDADPAPGAQPGWVTRGDSLTSNTGVNRTLTVTTPFHTAPTLTQGWTRVVIRALVRSSDDGLNFYVHNTYPVWVDDGPVTLPVPS